jgi:hypothetical protein
MSVGHIARADMVKAPIKLSFRLAAVEAVKTDEHCGSSRRFLFRRLRLSSAPHKQTAQHQQDRDAPHMPQPSQQMPAMHHAMGLSQPRLRVLVTAEPHSRHPTFCPHP